MTRAVVTAGWLLLLALVFGVVASCGLAMDSCGRRAWEALSR